MRRILRNGCGSAMIRSAVREHARRRGFDRLMSNRRHTPDSAALRAPEKLTAVTCLSNPFDGSPVARWTARGYGWGIVAHCGMASAKKTCPAKGANRAGPGDERWREEPERYGPHAVARLQIECRAQPRVTASSDRNVLYELSPEAGSFVADVGVNAFSGCVGWDDVSNSQRQT